MNSHTVTQRARAAWSMLGLAVAITTATAGLAWGLVPKTMSYQGVLTTNAGAPVADGNYDLTFRIYDVASGANPALWTETHAGVPITLGGFSVILGSVTPIDLAFDKKYWLGVQVAGDPAELSPRVELASSPYALFLKLPFSGTASSAGALFSLENSGAGPTLTITGRLEVGSDSTNGRFNLLRSGSTSPILTLFDRTDDGGAIEGSGITGAPLWQVFPDATGSGAELTLYRADGTAGVTADTRRNADNESFLQVQGVSRTVTLSTGANTDNGSVQLPNNAVSALETLDEIGVANNWGGITVLTSSVQSLLSRTIDCPTDGYVLALGTASILLSHVSGTEDNIDFAVSDDPAVIPSLSSNSVILTSGVPTGSHWLPISAQGLFEVTSGSHTFYLVGQEHSGSGQSQEHNLVLLFLPTTYGLTRLAASASPPETEAVAGPGLTPAQIAEERRASERFRTTRLAREVQLLKDQLREIEVQMAAQGTGAGDPR
jgi:hypothetical protein